MKDLVDDIVSVRTLVEAVRLQASHDFGNVSTPTDDNTQSSSGLSELDAVKLDMKIEQQYVRRLGNRFYTKGPAIIYEFRICASVQTAIAHNWRNPNFVQ